MPGPKPLAIVSCALLVGGAAAAQVPPFGGEFQANTYTTSTQRTPAVASSGNGKFIVVWSSFGQDGDRGGIYGQRYDASGQKAGSEFRVSSSTTGSAQRPSIAMAKDGSFVVAWDSYQDLFGPARPATPIPPSDIFARRFASDGTPLGEDFQVNTYTTGYQYGAVAAIDDAKEFVIVWQGGPSGAAGARRYDAAGAPTGDEFALGTSTGLKRSPAVAMTQAGDVVAVWSGNRTLGSGRGILGQRYDASGAPVGGEFEVDSATSGYSFAPAIVMDRHDNFCVVWSAPDGDADGVFGQRLNRSAEKVGPAFPVSSYTPSEQAAASVAVDSGGRFFVTWSSYLQDGAALGIYGQELDRSGGKIGAEMPMNNYTTSSQSDPKVAFDGSGFEVVWQSYGQDGDGFGIIGRRQTLHPRGFGVDAHATSETSSDANGVLEPGENVLAAPLWSNDSTLTSGNLAGSTPLTFCIVGLPCVAPTDLDAEYGTLPPGALGDCDDGSPDACFTVSAGGPRAGTHWDGGFVENLTAGGGNLWTLHVGDSFSDVPRSEPFYKKIETMLHFGVTSGCGSASYCPSAAVPRDQMSIFIAKALAGGGEYVPTTGHISGITFGTSYNCSAGGNSLFVDVAPTDSFCRHVHYLASRNVTLGCGNFRYCPAPVVTRDAMASFIAKAIVAPGGGGAVPPTYGPDPGTGRSYSCSAGSPNVHFADVPVSNAFCKHVHYLWAKGMVDGCTATKYCPASPVARDAMAKFIGNAFGLQLYSP